MSLKLAQRAAAESAILDAAAVLFAERGFHGVGMEEIARSCGCAAATLYGYFKGKQDLFGRLLALRTAEFIQGVEAAVERPGFVAGLGALVDGFIAFGEQHRAFVQLLISLHRTPETVPHHDAAAADLIRHHYVGLIEDLMRRGQAEGALRGGDPRLFAVGFLGLIHAAAADVFLDHPIDPLEPSVRFAAALFLTGAKAPEVP